MGAKERLEDIYFSLESKYYSFIDRLVEKGVPADRIVTAIEGKGIPSFPIFALVTILLIGGIGYGLYSVFGPKTYTITIYDANGNPLANTSVRIDGKMYVTDEHGQVKLKGIEGPVTVTVDGYKESSVDPEVSEYVYLAPIKKKVIITALERGSAKKLAGIRVKVYGRNTKEISGNPAVFYISEVPAENAVQVKDGKVIVEVLSTTHRKEKVSIEWSDKEIIEKTVYLTPIAEIVKRGTIVVYVKPDNVGGTAKLYSGSTLVKETPFENGIARFYSIPYGKYTVKFEVRIGGKTITDPKNSVDVDHKSSKTEAEITLTLPGYSGADEYDAPDNLDKLTAIVHVIDKNTGKVVSGAKLWDAKTKTRIGPKSNSKGIIEVTFTDSGGEMNAYVTKEKYYNSKYFVIRPGQEVNVYLVQMPATGIVNLCVITPTGDGGYMPVPKAYFKLWKDDWEVTGNAGADGCAKIEDVPVGDVNIYVTDPYGAYPVYDNVKVEEDKSTDKKVVLTMKVNVTVNVYSLENKDKRIAAVVEAYSGSGKKIGEEPTGISVGASFELPAKEYIYFKITYGKGKVYQTEMRIFYSDETVNIYVPEKETKSAEFVAIKNENGDRVFMLKPGKKYDLVLRVICKGSCSFPLSGKDINVPEEVNVSCTNICSKEVTVPISAEAQGEGVGSITVDGKEIGIPYGHELSEADARGSAYARILAFLDGKEADPDALSTLKEYEIVIPFAAKTAVDDPYIDVSSDLDLKDTETEVLGRMGDYVIGIVTFKVFAEERDRYEVVVDVEGGPEINLRLRFTKEGERKKMNLDVGSVALKNCEQVAIPYHLTDANTGEDLNGPISVDIYGDGWLYETLTLDEAKGLLEIPTGADKVLLVFRALGYYDANAMIELEEVKITPSKVTVTVAPDQKKASANIEYKVNPDWLDLNISGAEETYFDYHIRIKMEKKLKGRVTVTKDSNDFDDKWNVITVEQNATAETDQYSCTFQIHPEINVVETSKCKNFDCEDYLESLDGFISTSDANIKMILMTNEVCPYFDKEFGKSIKGTVTIRAPSGKVCEYNITNHVPLYYHENDYALLGYVGGSIISTGTPSVDIPSESSGCPHLKGYKYKSKGNNTNRTVLQLSVPKETLKDKGFCGDTDTEVIIEVNISCGDITKTESVAIPCKEYNYFDVSGVKLPCVTYNTNNRSCGGGSTENQEIVTVYNINTDDGKLSVDIAEDISNVDSKTWYGPYAALVILSKKDVETSIESLNVVFGQKTEQVEVKIGGYDVQNSGITIDYYDNSGEKEGTVLECVPNDKKYYYVISLKTGVGSNEKKYTICTDSPELAYYYWKQSQNWRGADDPAIMPITLKDVSIDKPTNSSLPDDCGGKLVSVKSINPAPLWLTDNGEVTDTTIFGKSLDDYYRLVAATAGYGSHTVNSDDKIPKDVPVRIILEPGGGVISVQPSKADDYYIKYSNPQDVSGNNELYRLFYNKESGKLYYMFKADESSVPSGVKLEESTDKLTIPSDETTKPDYCEGGTSETTTSEKTTITAYLKITVGNTECVWTKTVNCDVDSEGLLSSCEDGTWKLNSGSCPATPSGKISGASTDTCNVKVEMKYTLDEGGRPPKSLKGWANIGGVSGEAQVGTGEFTEIMSKNVADGRDALVRASLYDSERTWRYIFNSGEVEIYASCVSKQAS